MTAVEIDDLYAPLLEMASTDPLGALETWERTIGPRAADDRISHRRHRQWFRQLRRTATAHAGDDVASLAHRLEASFDEDPIAREEALYEGVRFASVELDVAAARKNLDDLLWIAPKQTAAKDGERLAEAFSAFIDAVTRQSQIQDIDRGRFASDLERVETIFRHLTRKVAEAAAEAGLTGRLKESRVWLAAANANLDELHSAYATWVAATSPRDRSFAALQTRRRYIHGLAIASREYPDLIERISGRVADLMILAEREEEPDADVAALLAGANRDLAFAYTSRRPFTEADATAVFDAEAVTRRLSDTFGTPETLVQSLACLRDTIQATRLRLAGKPGVMAGVTRILEVIGASAAPRQSDARVAKEVIQSSLLVLDLATDFEDFHRVQQRLDGLAAWLIPRTGERPFDLQWVEALHLAVYSGCLTIINTGAPAGLIWPDLNRIDAVAKRYAGDLEFEYFQKLAHRNARSCTQKVGPARVIYSTTTIHPRIFE